MADYSKMSDFEINRAVGEIALKGRWSCKPGTGGNDTESWYYGSVDAFVTPYAELPDYCNSWADAGPMAEEELISIYYDGDCWIGETGTEFGAFSVESDKPCRGIAIVFLMMKDAEKEQGNG